jgi:hypothetical protein
LKEAAIEAGEEKAKARRVKKSAKKARKLAHVEVCSMWLHLPKRIRNSKYFNPFSMDCAQQTAAVEIAASSQAAEEQGADEVHLQCRAYCQPALLSTIISDLQLLIPKIVFIFPDVLEIPVIH